MDYRKAVLLVVGEMTNAEIADEIIALRQEIMGLEAKKALADAEVSRLSKLAFDMAETSDRMKFQLILAGALISPPKKVA